MAGLAIVSECRCVLGPKNPSLVARHKPCHTKKHVSEHRVRYTYPAPPLRKHGSGPKNQAKQRFNAHPVFRQDRACVWHT